MRYCTQMGTLLLMGTSKDFDSLDSTVADILIESVNTSGMSYRDIRKDTGMSINRIGKIIRKEPPPATMGEIGQIASMLGTSASEIVAEAERRIGRTHTDAEIVEFPRRSEPDFSKMAALRDKEGPLDGQGADDIP